MSRHPEPPRRVSSVLVQLRFVGLAVWSELAFAVVYFFFVHTYKGQVIDELAYSGRYVHSDTIRVIAAARLTRISVQTVLVGIGVLVLIAMIRSRPRLAGAAATVVVGSVGTTELLKHVLLTRPEIVWLPQGGGLHNTFPSGHATTAFALAVALVMVTSPRWRGVVGLAAGTWAVIVAMSTLAAGWHRPADAAGAYLVVTFWTSIVVLVMVRWRGYVPEVRDSRHRHLYPWPVAGLIMAGAAVFAAVAAIYPVGHVVRAVHEGSPVSPALVNDAYYGALAVLLSVGIGTFALILLALRGVSLDPPRKAGERRDERVVDLPVAEWPADDEDPTSVGDDRWVDGTGAGELGFG